MAARKKKVTHPLTAAGHSRRRFARLIALFTLLPHRLSLSDSIKESGIQIPNKTVFGHPSPPSSPSAGLPNVILLASTPRLRFTGLSCGEQRELGLRNFISIYSRYNATHLQAEHGTDKAAPLAPALQAAPWLLRPLSPRLYLTLSPRGLPAFCVQVAFG